jgi:hypothetical protein
MFSKWLVLVVGLWLTGQMVKKKELHAVNVSAIIKSGQVLGFPKRRKMEIDKHFRDIMQASDLQRKWRVKVRTLARRKPVNGIMLGYVKDLVFYSNWLKDGWISITPTRWVVASACEEIADDEVPPEPPPATNLFYLLGDRELPAGLAKKRDRVPQTVRFIHYWNGNIRYTDDLIEWMLALNPSMSRSTWEGMSDAWNRSGEKFRDGERKYPFEVGFACNTHLVKRRLVWAGGLGVKPGTLMLELDTLHPDFLPDPESIIGSRYAIHLNTVAGEYVNPFSGRTFPPRLSALVSPVPLYIEAARCRAVGVAPNPYKPEWNW